MTLPLDGLPADPEPGPINSDLDWALTMYGTFARGGEEELMLYFVIDGAPWSKSRPRFGRGHAYQPKADADAERLTRAFLARQKTGMFLGNVMLACRFYRPNAQRIDTDNLLKHVCDSATGVLWKDDSQVTLTFGEIHLDAERPRTVIVVGNHESTLLRGDDRLLPCEHCETPFLPLIPTQRFCSKPCVYAARPARLSDRICVQCQAAFHPRTRTQTLCSRACQGAALADRNRSAGRPRSRCTECGAQLAHYRGGRCRACWRANPRIHTNITSVLEGPTRA